MSTQILPLAITMMAGPQIMTAIVFVTAKRPVPLSAAFLAGVAVAATAGVAIMFGIASLLGGDGFGDPDSSSSAGHVVQYVLVGLLVLLAIRNWRGRETAEPPKWMGTLQTADSKTGFKFGFLLIFLMPSDIVVMATVGVNLKHNDASLVDALPFIGLTVLIAALPILGYLLFHRRAQQVMPKVRDWMTANSWLINIIVCGIFILLIL